jgi:hypothetical protein
MLCSRRDSLSPQDFPQSVTVESPILRGLSPLVCSSRSNPVTAVTARPP